MTPSPLRKPGEKRLLGVISELLEGGGSSFQLPLGVERVERVTPEAVRIEFADEVDYGLLYSLAAEEGYIVEEGSFTPRVIDNGMILARVGSRSDPRGKHNIFIYLFPNATEQMNAYMETVAVRYGILDLQTRKINLQRFYEHNFKVIRLVEGYRRRRYESMIRRLES